MAPTERARERARRPPILRVQFSPFELPDTPENNRLRRRVTRRWVPRDWEPIDSPDEDDIEDQGEDTDNHEEVELEAAEKVSNLQLGDENVSVPVPSQGPSGTSSKRITASSHIDVPSDASNFLTASRANRSSGVLPGARARTTARGLSRHSTRPNRVPAMPSASRSPASPGIRRSRQLDENIAHMTQPTMNGAVGSHASRHSHGPSKAPAENSGHVNEPMRNGKRQVVMNLLSDEDEDEDASPRQHPSAVAGQRSENPRHMAPSATGVSPGSQAAFPFAGTNMYNPALRLPQPAGLEWWPFPTAPQAPFAHAQAPSQGYQPRAQFIPLQSQVPPGLLYPAWFSGIGAHSGQAQGNFPHTQQTPAKGVQASTNGVDMNMARHVSPGMFVEQPHDRPTPTARMTSSFNPPDRARTTVDPGGQHKLPVPQGRKVHTQQARAQSAASRPSGSSPFGPTRLIMVPEGIQSAQPPHGINMLSQDQRGQGMLFGVPPFTGCRYASYQPNWNMEFHPQAAANTNSTCAQTGVETTMGEPRSASNVARSVPALSKTKQGVKKDVQGPERSAKKRQDGARKPKRNFDESHFDGSDALSSSSRPKKQRLGDLTHDGSRLEVWQPYIAYCQTGSASTSQETKTQPKEQTSTAPGGIVPKAIGLSVQSQQVAEPNVDVVARAQRQDRPAATSLAMEGDHNETHHTGPGFAANSSVSHHQERTTCSPARNDPTKSVIGVGNEQRMEECDHIPSMLIEDDVDHGGDDEHSSSNSHGKLRAGDKGNKKSKTEIVSKQPSRAVTIDIPTKAVRLCQPPNDPSVPMGRDFFSRTPIEVRRRIYRELLKAKDSITVLKGWSQVYRHQQLDLHASILGVSKGHNSEANTVLYGENVFRYILRDDGRMVDFETGKKKKDERMLPLKKQIDNLRYLELEIEPNRIDLLAGIALYTALETLVDNKATKLSRLTIDLSPRLQQGVQGKKGMDEDWVSQRVWFTRAQGMTDMLKQLKPRSIFFDIHLEESNYCKAISLRTILKLRPEVSDNEVSSELRKHNNRRMSLEARRVLARERVEARLEAEAYKKLDMMNTRLEEAVLNGAPYMVRRGWFEFKSKRKQRKTIHGGASDVDLEDA